MVLSDPGFDMNRRFRGTCRCYLGSVISRLFPRSAFTHAGVTRRAARQALSLVSVLSLVACVSGVTDAPGDSSGASPGASGSAGGNTVFNNGGSAPVSGAGTGTSNLAGGTGMVGGGGAGNGGAGGTSSVVLCTFANWVAKMPYVTGDKVLYNGAGYIATMDNPGYDPTISTFFWSPFPCAPVPGSGGSGGSGSTAGATNSGGAAGGPTDTDPTCPLSKLLANGSVSFDAMFQPPWAGHVAKPLYSYTALCTAIATKGFTSFANSGDMTTDKRELAAFFAHVAKETAFLEQSDEAGEASNAQDYHGRGAIQLTGQSNYQAAGQYLGKDLVGNPGMVSTDPVTNWQTALWFWMINYNPGTAGVQNCHQAILGGDFGQTTRIINGGIECPGSQAAQDRAQYYKNDCSALSVDPGNNLVC